MSLLFTDSGPEHERGGGVDRGRWRGRVVKRGKGGGEI